MVAMPASLPRTVLKITCKARQDHFSCTTAWEAEKRENDTVLASARLWKRASASAAAWLRAVPQTGMRAAESSSLDVFGSEHHQTSGDWYSTMTSEMKWYFFISSLRGGSCITAATTSAVTSNPVCSLLRL